MPPCDESASVTIQQTSHNSGADTAFGWSAVAAAALAVLAWAACCVLPMALATAGVTLAGGAFLAGQRTWIPVGAALILAAGWWSVARRRRACAVHRGCTRPSQLSVILLGRATALLLLAVAWQPLIEPKALMFLRSLRG